MSPEKLNGLTVLITRPRDQSVQLARLITEYGGKSVIFPTIEILPIEPSCGWDSVFKKINVADIVVFTSANAVQEILSKKMGSNSQCKFAAIGMATQSAMLKYGIRCDWLPMKDYRSEGLLELPVFRTLENKKIIIMAGEGGRDYLRDVLEERGAEVEKIAVYRRICPSGDRNILNIFFTEHGYKVIVSTSVESLNNLISLSEGFADLQRTPLLVISNRIALAAKEKGFETIIVAENVSDEAILKTLSFRLADFKK